MNRRALLRSLGLAGCAALAGCPDSEAGGGSPENRPSVEADTDTTTATPSPTPTPTPTPNLRIVEKELIGVGKEDTPVRVEGIAENVSDRQLGQVVSTATFSDGDTQLGSWTTTAYGLEPGQRWLFSISSGEEIEDADGVALTIEERTDPSDLESDHVNISKDRLLHMDGNAVVMGMADNVSAKDLSYLEIAVTFDDGDGTLLGGAVADVHRGVEVAEEFGFVLRYSSPVKPDKEVEGYQLSVQAEVTYQNSEYAGVSDHFAPRVQL